MQFSNVASDWLTAVLAANQKSRLKTVLVNNNTLIDINVGKPDPRSSVFVTVNRLLAGGIFGEK